MHWKNVKLIYLREMRDQLRDRRTLFLIAVLPLLLYPLLGTSFFQLSQFLQHDEAKVLVVGARQLKGLDWLPPLVGDKYFDAALFDQPEMRQKLQIVWPHDFPDLEKVLRQGKHELARFSEGESSTGVEDTEFDKAARQLLDSGRVKAVLVFPSGFGDRLRQIRKALVERQPEAAGDLPEPIILAKSADDKSQYAELRVEQVIRHWRGLVTEKNLTASNVPVEATRPFELKHRDLSQIEQRQAAVWSKILPFFVFIWALTGAFYPAVDLCAGEKERGTLETLLTSPALRREIVWGKLLTVMTFSMVTALLNLMSLGATGMFVVDQLSKVQGLGAEAGLSLPPLGSLLWISAALLPISALFSALCLALAAFARSTKEGQYYLMPLMLVTLPLMMLPMSPGVELNLGNSLLPVTGMTLLLRAVIEGQFHQVLIFIGPVLAVTLVCCLLAVRWAEDQFNCESVLFRESERLELGRWLLQVVRDRGDTPSLPQAILCIALILVVKFFVGLASQAPGGGQMSLQFFVRIVVISQIACVFAPAAIMSIMLTRRPLKTLLLDRVPKLRHLLAAFALAVLVHPIAVRGGEQLQKLYPLAPEMRSTGEAIQQLMAQPQNWVVMLLLMAVLAPVCEEIAFRGFILSGARHIGHKWWAIAISAAAFGAVHLFVQQQIVATALGLLIGYMAVQTESLIPCIVYHAVHNALQFLAPMAAQEASNNPAWRWSQAFGGAEPWIYHPATVAVCGALAAAILWKLRGTDYHRTAEEQLEEARQRSDVMGQALA
jgi:sodium transport system permease protein